jgi:hypothetical protein
MQPVQSLPDRSLSGSGQRPVWHARLSSPTVRFVQ